MKKSHLTIILLSLLLLLVAIIAIIEFKIHSKAQKAQDPDNYNVDTLKIAKFDDISEAWVATFIALFSLKQFRMLISSSTENFEARNFLKEACLEKDLKNKNEKFQKFLEINPLFKRIPTFRNSINSCIVGVLSVLQEEQTNNMDTPENVEFLKIPENDVEKTFFYCLTKSNTDTKEIGVKKSVPVILTPEKDNMQSILNAKELSVKVKLLKSKEELIEYQTNHLFIDLRNQTWSTKWNGLEITKDVTFYGKKYELKVLISRKETEDFSVYVKRGKKVLKVINNYTTEHDISKEIEGNAKYAIYERVD